MDDKKLEMSHSLKWITEPVEFGISNPEKDIGVYCHGSNTCYDYTCTEGKYHEGKCEAGGKFTCYDFQCVHPDGSGYKMSS